MNIKYKLKEIYKGIFLVTIQDEYDLAMTFCRLQEYYESPFKQIRGKTFEMDEFQRMYAKKFGDGVFTYPADWGGFNVPGNVVDEFMSVTFPDWGNKYDCVISDIHWNITEEYESYNETRLYYLIGARPKDKDTINHEICHALYYLDKDYKFRVDYIISSLDTKLLNHFKSELLDQGYSKGVLIDEVNAYMCFDSSYLLTSKKLNKREKKNFDEVKTKLLALFNSTISIRKHLAK
jgi:hypothetical protein